MSDLIVVESQGATVVVQEVAAASIVEVITVGPAGARGLDGAKGDKGDTGDVTPAATAAKVAAEAAATAAGTARVAAEAARDQTLAAFDSFDDRYLGQKAADPTLDNDGNALVSGALYFNSLPLGSGGGMKVYDGSVWFAAYASLSGALISANNLADLASVSAARTNLSLDNVENKSSATIRGELTSVNVTNALGFTPYNAANPDGFITSSALAPYLTSASAASTYQPIGSYLTGITSGQVTTALGFTPYNATNPDGFITNSALTPYLTSATAASTYQTTLVSGTSIKTINGESLLGSGNIVVSGGGGGVASFNTRTGAVTLGSGDVTGALGFTPYNATNPTGFITSSALSPYLTAATAASTYQPIGSYLTGITSGQVTTALGFTPYNATNPDGFITSSALSPYLTSATAASTYQTTLVSGTSIKTVNGESLLGSGNIVVSGGGGGGVASFNTRTGAVTLGSGDVTDALGYTPVNKAGDTMSGNLTVANGTDSRVNLQVSGVTEGILTASSTNVRLSSANAIPITIGTNGVTRLTFTGTGFITTGASEFVGIGAQAGTNNGLRVARNLENSTSAFGVVSDGTFQSGVTATGVAYRTVLRTQAAAFTMADAVHYQAVQATLGAGSAITTQSGFVADSTLIGATNNYGFRGQIASGANRYNLYMDGTAANFLAGALRVDGALTQGTNQVLHAGNYTSYSPSLTGTGASGSWAINITGSAGSVATRTAVIATGTSITMNADTTDIATQNNTQATGTLTLNAPTGTPINGQKIMLRLTSTTVQTFSWNAVFRGSTDLTLPTASSGAGKEDYMGFIYDSTAVKWDLIAKNFGF